MRKLIVFVLLLCLVPAFSVALAQDDPLADVDPTGQTVTYWYEWSGAQQAAMDALIARFNETNEWDITVEAIAQGSGSAVTDLINAGIVSGELPNLAPAFQNEAQSYYRDGFVVDLQPYYNSAMWGLSEEAQADLDQSILDVNVFEQEPYNGARLLWPIGVSMNVMSVNLDMLAAVGYDAAPTTFEDFTAIACATNELTGANDADIQGFPMRTNANDFESFAASFGGSIYDEATGLYTFTNQGVIDAFTLMQELYQAGCSYIPATSFGNTDEFAFGLNPMALGSNVGLPFIRNNIANSGSGVENWIFTTTPYTEGNRTIQVFLRSLVMFPSTPEQQLATWLFMRFLAQPENQIEWASQTFYVPYSTEARAALDAEFMAANPQFEQAVALLNDPEINVYASPQTLTYGQIRGLIETAVADVTSGGRDVMEVAQELEAAANQIVADSM